MTTDRLAALVSEILVDMEEAQLCPDCIADTCEAHEEMPESYIGCNDAREIAARLRAAGVTVAQPDEIDLDEQFNAVDKTLLLTFQWSDKEYRGRYGLAAHGFLRLLNERGWNVTPVVAQPVRNWTCRNCARGEHEDCKQTMGPDTCVCQCAPARPVVREGRGTSIMGLVDALDRIRDITKPLSITMEGPRWTNSDKDIFGGGNREKVWRIADAAIAATQPAPAQPAPDALRECPACTEQAHIPSCQFYRGER